MHEPIAPYLAIYPHFLLFGAIAQLSGSLTLGPAPQADEIRAPKALGSTRRLDPS